MPSKEIRHFKTFCRSFVGGQNVPCHRLSLATVVLSMGEIRFRNLAASPRLIAAACCFSASDQDPNRVDDIICKVRVRKERQVRKIEAQPWIDV